VKLRLVALALALLLTSAFVAPIGTASAQSNPLQNIPVTGTIPLPDQTTGTFSGLLDITQFAVQDGQLVAVGTLEGTLTNAAGGVIGTVQNVPITLPVTSISGSCELLHLELGPLDLDLLGLQVHLDKIVLDITAQSGPGNLVGNLLCAIAGLLDSGGPLSQIVNLLNQLLGLLG
jgi:hypothetical protein